MQRGTGARCRGRCRAPRERRRTLFAAICSPWPLPPSTMPRSARPADDGAAHAEADGRVVDRGLARRAVVVNRVPELLQRPLEVLLQQKARVIGADGNTHKMGIVPDCSTFMGPSVVISARGEQRLQTGHPWIYRADVAHVRADGGDIVAVRAPRGRTVGHALYSSRSQIALRMLSYGDEPADASLIRRRIESAIAFRGSLAIDATAYRLVHGEADLLPSLIVDATATISSSRRSPRAWTACCRRLSRRSAKSWRRAASSRATIRRAGCSRGWSSGSTWSRAKCRSSCRVTEIGVEYDVDVRHGQKTGLFLDQRENRAAAAVYAHGRLLDCFSYHGGFALVLGAGARRHLRSTCPRMPSRALRAERRAQRRRR